MPQTSKSTSDDKEELDTHELLVREMLVYLRWGPRFEQFHYKESAVKARAALLNIRNLATKRYREIQATKHKVHGNQKQGTSEDDSTT